MTKATDFIKEDLRFDLRLRRATSFAALIMNELQDYIPRASQRDFYDRLLDLLMKCGVDAVTDKDRMDAGLPPRDGKGWTAQELVALEAFRLEQILKPLERVIIFPKD